MSEPTQESSLVNNISDTTNGFVGIRLEGSATYSGSDWSIFASSDTESSTNDFLGFHNNSTTDSATVGYKMTINKSGNITFNTYTAGTLTTDSNGVISTSSDERLKTIDGYFTAGLNEVLQIKPILYHWNELSQFDTENMYAGFSAQNIQSVIPIATMAQKDTGYLSLQDRPIIAALVNSIKEQNDIITNLLSRIVILENK